MHPLVPNGVSHTMKNYYHILQISPNADLDIIKTVYRKLSHKYHPDKSSDPNASQIMADINEAYECLSNKAKRSLYDQLLFENTNVKATPFKQKVSEPQLEKEKLRSHQHSSTSKISPIEIFTFLFLLLCVIWAVVYQSSTKNKSAPDTTIQDEHNITSDMMYKYGFDDYNQKRFLSAYKWFNKAAEKGHVAAQSIVGNMFYRGNGVKQDYPEAFKWFNKAAKQGFADAQYWLGVSYYKGQGVKQNYSEAFKWFKKAAKQGRVNALYWLGISYYEGHGVKQNFSKALQRFNEAAKLKDIASQYILGSIYYSGNGVKQNYHEAFRWFKKASSLGSSDAQNMLGELYYHGYGVNKNYSESLTWYHQAAEQGNVAAQRRLKTLASIGLTKKYIEQLRNAHRAIEQGAPNATQYLNKIANIYLMQLSLGHVVISLKNNKAYWELSVGDSTPSGWTLMSILAKRHQIKISGPDGQIYFLKMSSLSGELQIDRNTGVLRKSEIWHK